MTNDIITALTSQRGTFTSKNIAVKLDSKYAIGAITKALRSMSHVREVSKGIFKVKGRAV